jgi:hypothetical protein
MYYYRFFIEFPLCEHALIFIYKEKVMKKTVYGFIMAAALVLGGCDTPSSPGAGGTEQLPPGTGIEDNNKFYDANGWHKTDLNDKTNKNGTLYSTHTEWLNKNRDGISAPTNQLGGLNVTAASVDVLFDKGNPSWAYQYKQSDGSGGGVVSNMSMGRGYPVTTRPTPPF